ncbi:MAG: T9SS type A sorting domain-containing protein [Clostridium sp.]|nr:T9SS type A sorting domain-containing protein [Clostridium sp.]
MVVSPAGDRAFRVFLAGASRLDVVVSDIAGKSVLHTVHSGDDALIDVSGLSRGVYVLSVNGAYSQKVVIK